MADLYAVATGHDATSLTPIETLTTHAPIADRPPRGSVRRKTFDRATRFNGAQIVFWRWVYMSREGLDNLLAVRGPNGEVTIRTPNERDVFDDYNAMMAEPQPQSEYTRTPGACGAVEPLAVEFDLLARLYADLLLEDGGLLLLEDGASLLLE